MAHSIQKVMEVPMENYLKMADKRQILTLLELGWGYRRIQRETEVDRGRKSRR